MFHIHVDANKLSQELENYLLENLSFQRTNFSGHPQGVAHYESPIHLTSKTSDSKEFRNSFKDVIDLCKERSEEIEGYVEGEYIPLDIDIEEKPFNPEIKTPCRFELVDLAPGTFREDEIHITLDRDKSDPRLIENLRKNGVFLCLYGQSSSGRVEILTVQGKLKANTANYTSNTRIISKKLEEQ